MQRNLLVLLIGVMVLFTTQVGAQTVEPEALNAQHIIDAAREPADIVALSPDGMRVAVGDRDHVVRVWDAQTGALVSTSVAHTDWVTALAFSPDGQVLVSGSRDFSVRLIDPQTGELLHVLGRHEAEVTALAYSADGRLLVSGARDGTLAIYHTQTGEVAARLNHPGGAVWHLAFGPLESAEGDTLAIASEDGAAWLWRSMRSEDSQFVRLGDQDIPMTRVAFSGDGRYLLTGDLQGRVHLWDVTRAGSQTQAAWWRNAGDLPITGLGFSEDNRVAITAGLDGRVRLWDVSRTLSVGGELAQSPQHVEPILHLALNNSGQLAASVTRGGQLVLWDTSAYQMANITAAFDTAAQPSATVPPPGVVLSTQSARAPRAVAPQTVTGLPSRPVEGPQLPPSAPGRWLHIPSVQINSPITTFPLDGESWAIDPWESKVGHFQGTAWMNSTGNIALGAHSEYPDGREGTFYHLYDVGIGDEIVLREGDGERRYMVVNIRDVDYRDISVIYPTTTDQLTLVTCDIPSYVADTGLYYERLVVIAVALD